MMCNWCNAEQPDLASGLIIQREMCAACYDRERAHNLVDSMLRPILDRSDWGLGPGSDPLHAAYEQARDILTPAIIEAGMHRDVALTPEDLGAEADAPWVRKWHAGRSSRA